LCDRRGAALIEYGILAGLVAIAALGAVATLGGKVSDTFGKTTTALSAALDGDAGHAGVGADGGDDTVPAGAIKTWTLNVGYYNASAVGRYGMAGEIFNQAGPFDVDPHFYDTNNGILNVFASGDQRTLLADATMTCDDGTSLQVSDAVEFTHVGSGLTWISWQNSGVSYADGDVIRCGFYQ
jgi:pilus assembly protein Flp/PilA